MGIALGPACHNEQGYRIRVEPDKDEHHRERARSRRLIYRAGLRHLREKTRVGTT